MPCTCSRRPSAVRHRMKPLLLGSAALMLSGCVDQADWSVVTANSEDFKACLQNPSVTWLQQAADPSLRASVGPAITEPASFDARTGIPPQNAFAAALERTQQSALRVGDPSLARMASADEAFVRQRDESAEAATRVLYHPVQGTIDQMVTDVAAGRPVSVTFGASEIREYAARAREAVDKNGWGDSSRKSSSLFGRRRGRGRHRSYPTTAGTAHGPLCSVLSQGLFSGGTYSFCRSEGKCCKSA